MLQKNSLKNSQKNNFNKIKLKIKFFYILNTTLFENFFYNKMIYNTKY